MNLRYIPFLLVLTLISCLVSVKPVYNEKEQAKAARAVEAFHKLYNEENYQGLYDLLAEEAKREVNKDEFQAATKQAYEKWGKVQSSNLSEAKVFPSPLQVRMIYNVKFEKGDAQEWFIWDTRGNEARLLQYQHYPGFDKPEIQK